MKIMFSFSKRPLITSFLIFLILSSFMFSFTHSPDPYPDYYGAYQTDPKHISRLLSNEQELPLFDRKLATAFYGERENKLAWKSSNLRNSFLDTLKMAKYQGLYYEDYHKDQLQPLLGDYNNLNAEEQSKLDILLTDAFLKFSKHLLFGKTDPAKLHEVWNVPRKKIDLANLLQEAVNKNDLEVALGSIRPGHKMYGDLIAASKEYIELEKSSGEFETIPQGEILKEGKQDQRIPLIASRLETLGYLEQTDTTLKEYTKEIAAAVKKLQRKHNLKTDGILGPETLAVLNTGYADRHRQILVNLERWRWYPRDLGKQYLILNIPEYKLRVINEQDTVDTHKTVVGIPSRPTPLFSDQIVHFIFNPAWFIPPTIKNEDVIPKVRRDPGYLERNNIVVYNQNWQQVDPANVNWDSPAVRNFFYKQKPGKDNPMGRVKIMYPNDYAIYSHDTPAQHLFDLDKRAHSSGCVRVERALELTKFLLRDKSSPDEIDKIVSHGEREKIEINQKVQVHHFYWTVWRQNGETRFIKDLYNYDEATYKAMKAAS